ncbi:uncharacterized protein PF11_0207-like [Ipomoea triloba]|uniref:uncharacterized protein PF11_0207-like n=1 Tax=Ipomoea triloba TaxID=35885 RepID=UPI00125E1817|nr:uncharacterized protein PF11_0207-like [Ipomoea triloba]
MYDHWLKPKPRDPNDRFKTIEEHMFEDMNRQVICYACKGPHYRYKHHRDEIDQEYNHYENEEYMMQPYEEENMEDMKNMILARIEELEQEMTNIREGWKQEYENVEEKESDGDEEIVWEEEKPCGDTIELAYGKTLDPISMIMMFLSLTFDDESLSNELTNDLHEICGDDDVDIEASLCDLNDIECVTFHDNCLDDALYIHDLIGKDRSEGVKNENVKEEVEEKEEIRNESVREEVEEKKEWMRQKDLSPSKTYGSSQEEYQPRRQPSRPQYDDREYGDYHYSRRAPPLPQSYDSKSYQSTHYDEDDDYPQQRGFSNSQSYDSYPSQAYSPQSYTQNTPPPKKKSIIEHMYDHWLKPKPRDPNDRFKTIEEHMFEDMNRQVICYACKGPHYRYKHHRDEIDQEYNHYENEEYMMQPYEEENMEDMKNMILARIEELEQEMTNIREGWKQEYENVEEKESDGDEEIVWEEEKPCGDTIELAYGKTLDPISMIMMFLSLTFDDESLSNELTNDLHEICGDDDVDIEASLCDLNDIECVTFHDNCLDDALYIHDLIGKDRSEGVKNENVKEEVEEKEEIRNESVREEVEEKCGNPGLFGIIVYDVKSLS